MSQDKYVKWEHVESLLSLIKTRDSFHSWSSTYEQYDIKVKDIMEWLEKNAKEVEVKETDFSERTFDEDFYQKIKFGDF